jgi:hypothetical protein
MVLYTLHIQLKTKFTITNLITIEKKKLPLVLVLLIDIGIYTYIDALYRVFLCSAVQDRVAL